MIYKKPHNVSYTDMAIFIDDTIYTDKKDEMLTYQYLYHLINMLAHKQCLFSCNMYYEEFSLYGASQVYLRLTNPKQFELDNNGQPHLEKIKSVLNYIKRTLYPMKVDFEQENYSQVAYDEENELDNNSSYVYIKTLSQDTSLDSIEFMDYLHRITDTIKSELVKIPYIKDKATWKNIYLSCLLTFLNSITLSNKNKEKLYMKDNIMYTTESYIDKVYREENQDSTLLFHLDPTMKDYIKVLTNKVKKKVAKDLSDMIRSWEPAEDMVKNLMFTLVAESRGKDKDEY